MNGVNLKGVQCLKGLGVTVASNLKLSKQCKDATRKAYRMLRFINRNFFKNKDTILPVYITLVRPHLKYSM